MDDLIYVEPAEYINDEMRRILEKGANEEAQKEDAKVRKEKEEKEKEQKN